MSLSLQLAKDHVLRSHFVTQLQRLRNELMSVEREMGGLGAMRLGWGNALV